MTVFTYLERIHVYAHVLVNIQRTVWKKLYIKKIKKDLYLEKENIYTYKIFILKENNYLFPHIVYKILYTTI